jgi:hypothetical protein
MHFQDKAETPLQIEDLASPLSRIGVGEQVHRSQERQQCAALWPAAALFSLTRCCCFMLLAGQALKEKKC